MEKISWPRHYSSLLLLLAVITFAFPLHQMTPSPTLPPQKSVLQATTGSCTPPYASVWRTAIPAGAGLDAKNSQYITTLTGPFGSDVSQFTMPVYRVTSSTTSRTMTVSGVFSDVTNNGNTLTKRSGAVTVQSPAGAQQAAGSDAQIVFWNQTTGDEWGFWQVKMNADGSGTAVNGYHYNTNWSGVPPVGFGSRGAGVPYLTGLIMPCEITQGHIDHPIALAYQSTSSSFVYPATKSDGTSTTGMPEGTHLQLDPSLSPTQIQAWGCTAACLTIAKAMQQYGLIIIDKGGHPKVYAEYEGTAHWGGVIDANTVAKIPYSALRVLTASAVPTGNITPTISQPQVTVIPTPSTSSGPSATPAVSPGSSSLSLSLFLHGLGKAGDNVGLASGGNASPLTTQRQVSVTIYTPSNQLAMTASGSVGYVSSSGSFTGTVALGSLASGIYTAKIQVPGFLVKTLPGILSVTTNQVISVPSIALVTGDTNNDNVLNIIDYNTILDCFSDLTPPRNCTPTKKTQTDMTDDGNVNQFDYNLFLREISVQSGS